MSKITNLLFILIIFIGCGNEDEIRIMERNQTKVASEISEKVVSQKAEETLLNEMGFQIINDKIIIDMNKSSHFFSNIEKKMETQAKEIQSGISNFEMNITDDYVHIDLNRTKFFLENLSGFFESMIFDLNTTNHQSF